MSGFMFQLELPEMTADIASLIPRHRAYVNRMFSSGRIVSYIVSEARNMIWCVIQANDEQEAMNIVLAFPLYPMFTDVVCHPLLFHNTMASVPGISLN